MASTPPVHQMAWSATRVSDHVRDVAQRVPPGGKPEGYQADMRCVSSEATWAQSNMSSRAPWSLLLCFVEAGHPPVRTCSDLSGRFGCQPSTQNVPIIPARPYLAISATHPALHAC